MIGKTMCTEMTVELVHNSTAMCRFITLHLNQIENLNGSNRWKQLRISIGSGRYFMAEEKLNCN